MIETQLSFLPQPTLEEHRLADEIQKISLKSDNLRRGVFARLDDQNKRIDSLEKVLKKLIKTLKPLGIK